MEIGPGLIVALVVVGGAALLVFFATARPARGRTESRKSRKDGEHSDD